MMQGSNKTSTLKRKVEIKVGWTYVTRDGRILKCVGKRINIISYPIYEEEHYFLFPLSGAGTYAVQADGMIFLNDTEDDIVAYYCASPNGRR